MKWTTFFILPLLMAVVFSSTAYLQPAKTGDTIKKDSTITTLKSAAIAPVSDVVPAPLSNDSLKKSIRLNIDDINEITTRTDKKIQVLPRMINNLELLVSKSTLMILPVAIVEPPDGLPVGINALKIDSLQSPPAKAQKRRK